MAASKQDAINMRTPATGARISTDIRAADSADIRVFTYSSGRFVSSSDQPEEVDIIVMCHFSSNML